MEDDTRKVILKMIEEIMSTINNMSRYSDRTPMFVSAIPIKKRNIKSQKSERQKILDKMAVLKELINKSLDIKDYNNFNKYTKEYNRLINRK